MNASERSELRALLREELARVDDGQCLTQQQVADRLACSRTSVHHLLASGELPHVVVAGKRKVRLCDLRAYLNRQLVTS